MIKVKKKPELEETYVLKKRLFTKDDSYREKMQMIREARILYSITHKSIIKFHDAFRTERDELCIVTEYCEKGNLAQLIKQHKENSTQIDIRDIFKYVAQICAGLEHMHNYKVLHRDLMPSNIFLADDDTVRIGDVGSAKVFQHTISMAKTGDLGTKVYMAPEMFSANES